MFSDSMMGPEGREGFRTPSSMTIDTLFSNTSKTPCAGCSDFSRGRRFVVVEKRRVMFCYFSIYYRAIVCMFLIFCKVSHGHKQSRRGCVCRNKHISPCPKGRKGGEVSTVDRATLLTT